VISAIGPEHAKTFTVEVRVGDAWSAVAAGASKKTAGLSAAGTLLEKLKSAEDSAPGA
jgi:dsRNA-specific ribonuclease